MVSLHKRIRDVATKPTKLEQKTESQTNQVFPKKIAIAYLLKKRGPTGIRTTNLRVHKIQYFLKGKCDGICKLLRFRNKAGRKFARSCSL